MNETAPLSRDGSRAAQAKACCAIAFALNCLWLFIADAFDVHGLLWNVIQDAIGVIFIVALAAWILFSLRSRRPGAIRPMLVASLMAVAAATALALLATRLD